MKSRLSFATLFVTAMAGIALGQTFDVNGQGKPPASTSNKQSQAQGTQNLSWGSSIEVARQARAAQDALKKGDYAAATTFAEQAAKSAPQNTDLWFLLGYSARLAGRYQVSVDAYQRGLRNQPNSIQGLAGLAQTYAKMGREAEARQLLTRVVEANPKDANTLGLAGELFLASDPQRALDLLRRADSLQPSAHTELLIARIYERLNQPEAARQFLAQAKARAPHDPEVLRAVAGQYRDAGQYDLAIAALQSVPSKTPEVLAELAYTYELAGKKQQSADLYTQIANSAKGNVGLMLSAAQALVNLGQLEAARNFLDKAQALDAHSYRLHAIQGQIAESEDRIPDAIKEYQSAISNLPHVAQEGPLYPVQLRMSLYELYLRNNEQAEAKQQLDLVEVEIGQVQVPDSSRPEFLRLRAAIETSSGNLEAAQRDLQEALQLAPSNVNSMLNYATLMWKLGQKEAARKQFLKALEADPHNRVALTSLGYLSRDMGDTQEAKAYFSRAIEAAPQDFGPYLALGDLYTAERDFSAAQTNYETAYKQMPANPLIVAGGANAALEGRNLELAKQWLDRSTGTMNNNPQVMRERQRYLTWKGEYKEAAQLGYKVIEQLPKDPQAPVYLAYDLYFLGQYQDALDLAIKYEPALPNNKDLALIAGYVHARAGQFPEALADFTRALDRDPQMATGYANRGFVLTDLRQANKALQDFRKAIELRPGYGEAHLGLAYAYLQLHRPKPALEELEIAKKSVGEVRIWHLARAEAFRQEQRLPQAEKEYRAALEETPNDVTTLLALSETLYRMRHYNECITTLNTVLKLSPGLPVAYAQMAQAEARMGNRQEAIRYIQAAEQYGKGDANIAMATGDALLALGDNEAAMQRFSRALETASEDRIGVRLAIAQIFIRQGHADDARRQIGLAFAEGRVGEASPPTADNFIEAANILLALHDFDLAQTNFERARLAGANERVVAIGLANAYMAEGQTQEAETQLASLGSPADYHDDYDYQMAQANLYRQRQDTVHAWSAFARAGAVAGPNDIASLERAEYEVAAEEGRPINQTFSLSSVASFAPVLEDINIYTMDAKILGVTNPELLPPPRHSFQSLGEALYRIHLDNFPTIQGFAGESLTQGTFLFPSDNVVQQRNTFDTMLNGGISPVLRLGTNTLTLNAGIQFTIRRDTSSPVAMDQNLFRQFLYLSTNSFFNWVAVRGSLIHEAGPFTQQDLNSRDVAANLEFQVGRPWGKTSILAGYTVRDLLFSPRTQEYFNTSTYVGVQRKFGDRFTATILAAYLRSWRVQDNQYAIAQALVPGARFEYRHSVRWNVEGAFTLSRGEGYHLYDNAQGEFMISYTRPVRGSLADGTGRIPVSYPWRFSFGVQQQTFYDFPGGAHTVVLPVVRFNLF